MHEIRAHGGKAISVVCDVGQESDVAKVADAAVRAFGGIDTWVNNAGISIFGRTWDVPLADWRRMFETVYWGVVYGSLTALRYFRKNGQVGAIVNVGFGRGLPDHAFFEPTTQAGRMPLVLRV